MSSVLFLLFVVAAHSLPPTQTAFRLRAFCNTALTAQLECLSRPPFSLCHITLTLSLSHLLHLITYRYSRIAQRNALLSQAKCCNIHTHTDSHLHAHTHTHICACLCMHVSSFSSLSLLRWRLKLIFNNITHKHTCTQTHMYELCSTHSHNLLTLNKKLGQLGWAVAVVVVVGQCACLNVPVVVAVVVVVVNIAQVCLAAKATATATAAAGLPVACSDPSSSSSSSSSSCCSCAVAIVVVVGPIHCHYCCCRTQFTFASSSLLVSAFCKKY